MRRKRECTVFRQADYRQLAAEKERPVMVRNRIYKESQGGEDRYEDKPEQVKHREERNRLRAEETKRLGHKPTGDVAHIIPISSKRSDTSNVRVETVRKNRGWRKGESGYKVPKEK